MKFANKNHPRILCRTALLSATAAFALLFAPTSGAAAGANLPQDDVRANLAPETGAERTDLRAHQDNTRCVTQAETTTGYSRLVTRGESSAAQGKAVPAGHSLSRVMHAWPVAQEDGGATLLFSDSPEYATQDGVLYRDVVQGAARVLYYHVNQRDAPKKVAVVLENVGAGTSMVTISRSGAGRPSPHYLDVGKETQALYFDTQKSRRFYMNKGEVRVLDDAMEQTVLAPGDLVYGTYDFTTTQEMRVSVVIYPATMTAPVFLKHASVLPADELHLRGTFAKADRTLRAQRAYDPAADGIVYVLLADNESDRYRTGIDATDGSRVLNYGNYGILYHLELPVQGRSRTQFYLSPFGGTYAGAMRVQVRSGQQQLLLTPPDRTYFGEGSDEMTEASGIERARSSGLGILMDRMELADIGSYNTNSTPSFLFSPPGASNLPAALIMMPVDKK